MEIHGFTKTTLLDYPGHVACTVFTAGCNFRCPFCHNGDLVIHPEIYPIIDESEIFSHISKRHNVLSGVCISGGEPTLQPDLPDFLARIRDTGLLIKLDTNGYNPDILNKIIQDNLVDYVAMDIKSSLTNYHRAVGFSIDTDRIATSVDILNNSNIQYEFRTTCVKGIHETGDFEEIAHWLPNDCMYFLQSFKENDSVFDKSCSSFSKEQLLAFRDIIISHIPAVALRGID